jgi:hypothetical protein
LRNNKTQKFHSFQVEDLLAFNFYQNYKKMRSFELLNRENFLLKSSFIDTPTVMEVSENVAVFSNKIKKN